MTAPEFNASCPLPIQQYPHVLMAHGGGGKLMHQLLETVFGRAFSNPILDTLKRFRPAYERKLRSLDVAPAFDLDGALHRARKMTGRDDADAHLEAQP